MKEIDINCDLGEGFGNEAELMPFIQSCNIACGGHAGNRQTMLDTIQIAKKHAVKIGAHPSYPDKANFGRLSLEIGKNELQDSLREQLLTFQQVISEVDAVWHHIKPHGALYNDVAANKELATCCIEVFTEFKVKLFAPYGSAIAQVAQEFGLTVIYEGFADRNYNDDLSLVSRKKARAVLNDVETIISHVKRMFYKQQVLTLNGDLKHIQATTFCVHSDTDNAVAIVKNIFLGLKQNN